MPARSTTSSSKKRASETTADADGSRKSQKLGTRNKKKEFPTVLSEEEKAGLQWDKFVIGVSDEYHILPPDVIDYESLKPGKEVTTTVVEMFCRYHYETLKTDGVHLVSNSLIRLMLLDAESRGIDLIKSSLQQIIPFIKEQMPALNFICFSQCKALLVPFSTNGAHWSLIGVYNMHNILVRKS
jgi:hypothetical protein